jgi:hypothetical protein
MILIYLIYLMMVASVSSFCWSLWDIWRILKNTAASSSDPGFPPLAGTGVRLSPKPSDGSGTAFAIPEIDGNAPSSVP